MTQPSGGDWNLRSELVPSRGEMAKIIDKAMAYDERYGVLFTFCANVGLRISEAIHVKDTDLVNGKLRTMRRKKRKLQMSTVEISDWIFDLMTKYAKGKKGYLFPGNSAPCIVTRSNGEVIQVCKGKHLHVRSAQTRWRLILLEAGLYVKGRGIHQTRHYFGTEFYDATKDLLATQAAMDHSSPVMTQKYAHVRQLKEAANKVKPTGRD